MMNEEFEMLLPVSEGDDDGDAMVGDALERPEVTPRGSWILRMKRLDMRPVGGQVFDDGDGTHEVGRRVRTRRK